MFAFGENLLTALLLGWFTVSDLRSGRVWMPAAVLSALAALLWRLAFGESVAEGFAGMLPGVVLLVLARFTGEAVGRGDGAAVAAAGAALGFEKTFEMAFIAIFFAALWSIRLLVRSRDLKQRFAFIPFLLAAHICLLV